VDESLSYHDVVASMYSANGPARAIPAHLIFDAHFLRTYGLGVVHPGSRRPQRHVQQGYLARGNTLQELAARIGIDPIALAQTVARHNQFAQSGVDEDFGKGSTRFGRSGGDPRVAPNPCLAPIIQAPFYALAVWPAPTASGIGLATNEDGQVVDRKGEAVPGLYACGNDMTSIFDGVATGPGLTLGPAMVFAYRAAMAAARTMRSLSAERKATQSPTSPHRQYT
jgi:3-oxosteroid 1-dehydrogenase